LYEVKSNESSPHIADMNNALQNFALPAFDINVIAYYWRGWQRSPELLITGVAGNARRTYKP